MSVKLRLIPVLYIKNGLIVRSEEFSIHQVIGNVVNEAHRYNEWDVDELIYIDISRTSDYDLRRDDHKISSYSTIEEVIEQITKVCFMPLSIGGGIRSIEQVDRVIRSGADKVVVNTAIEEHPSMVQQIATRYGSQCIVASVDYKMLGKRAVVHTNFGERNTGEDLVGWIKRCEDLGSGEIFLNSIDRDGKAVGYDLDTIAQAVQSTRLPVIACGGAGQLEDFVALAKHTKVSAVAAGNVFHFTERSYPRAKKLMKKNGINVR